MFRKVFFNTQITFKTFYKFFFSWIQNKTFLIALKLAQFDFLRRTGSRTTPILLLDDIFDKLDAVRVEQIVKLVSGDSFGQIFITDTNRDHLDNILQSINQPYSLFIVEDGEAKENNTNQ